MRKGCVSIIVPVYNQASYIEKCLKTIINQTYQNLQIIVVDDGSVDTSVEILDRYAAEDNRIEVYHVKNKGVSEARNYALHRVKGEYIQFVDADDRMNPDMTLKLVTAIERNEDVDMIVCNYIKIFKKIRVYNKPMDRAGIYSAGKYVMQTLKDPGHHYYGVVWNKLYRSKLIQENQLYFDKNVTLGEDFIFNLKYWCCCGNVMVCNDYHYLYSKFNGASLSNVRVKSIDDCIKELVNREKIFEVYRNVLRELNISQKLMVVAYRYWIVFESRQKYALEHEYTGWTRQDKLKWKHIIDNNKYILKASRIVPDKWKRRYFRWYRVDYQIKRIVKKLIRI